MRQDDPKASFQRSRRRTKEYFYDTPLRKRIGRKIEELNKALTFSLLGKILGIRKVKGPLPIANVRSILILRYDALGDMVVTTPLWRTLKQRHPGIRIGVAGSFRNLHAIEHDPDVDVRYDFSPGSFFDTVKRVRAARNERWDLVIALVFNEKTRGAIVARLASPGVTSTIVRNKIDRYQKLYSIVGERPDLDPPTHMLEQCVHALETALDITLSDDEKHASIMLNPSEEQQSRGRLLSTMNEMGVDSYIHINTESATPYREWGFENVWEFATRFCEKHPSVGVLLSISPSRQAELLAFLESHRHPRIRHYPTPTFTDLVTLVRDSLLVMSPDTSVIHIASAERKPTIGFYVARNEWFPYKVPHKVFIPDGQQAVSTIPVDDVLEAATQLLGSVVERIS